MKFPEKNKINWIKFSLTFTVCLAVRLIPFRPPNIEPILAVQMPFARLNGALGGFIFAVLSIVSYDIITGTLGPWTLMTSVTYGLLGVWAGFYFKQREGTVIDYMMFALWGTMFFDVVTGVILGPLIFSQSFYQAFVGQIPFTLMHLLGNVSFAVFLSPAIYRIILHNKKLESLNITSLISLKRT